MNAFANAPAAPGRFPGFGRALVAVGAVWVGLCVLVALYTTGLFISEYNSCGDVARLSGISPTFYGVALSVPGLAMMIVGQRMTGGEPLLTLPRFLLATCVVCVVTMTVGTLWPKPGLPCVIRRYTLTSELRNLASAQQAYFYDHKRYATSAAALAGSLQQMPAAYPYELTIVWADSTSWGAYLKVDFSPPGNANLSWVCAGVYAPPSHTSTRVVEGIGRMQNKCWRLDKPNRLYPGVDWD